MCTIVLLLLYGLVQLKSMFENLTDMDEITAICDVTDTDCLKVQLVASVYIPPSSLNVHTCKWIQAFNAVNFETEYNKEEQLQQVSETETSESERKGLETIASNDLDLVCAQM